MFLYNSNFSVNKHIDNVFKLIYEVPEDYSSVSTKDIDNGIVNDDDEDDNDSNDSNDSKNSKHNLTFYDFRCSWKEAGLFGDVDSFGLTLRFYDDLSTQIKFDGVSGVWLLAKLEVVDCL